MSGCASTTDSKKADELRGREEAGACIVAVVHEGRRFTPHAITAELPVVDPIGPVERECLREESPREQDAGAPGTSSPSIGWSLAGIDPDTAFAVPSAYPQYVFVASEVDTAELEIELRRLLEEG